MLLLLTAFILALQASLFQALRCGSQLMGEGNGLEPLEKVCQISVQIFCDYFTSEKSHPHFKAVVWGLARGTERQNKYKSGLQVCGVSAHFGTGKVCGTRQDSASVNCVFAGYLCPSFVPDPWCIKNCSSQLLPLDVCDTQRVVCDGQRGIKNC